MKRFLAILLVAVLALSAFAGCASKAADNAAPALDGSYGEPYYAAEGLAAPSTGLYGNYDIYDAVPESDGSSGSAPDPGGNTTGTTTADYGLKIIYTASLSIETLDFDASYAAIMAQLHACGGYTSYSDQYGGTTQNGYYSARYAEFEFRIPAQNYDAFLSATSGFGNVTRRSETTQDVTGSYADIEARILTLETQETRLLALLADSRDLDMLLVLEDKLAAVRYEIEGYRATLNRYDDLVSFCTVGISLTEVATITPVKTRTFWQETWDTIQQSLYSVGQVGKTVLFGFLYVLPYLLFFALVALLVWLPVRARRRKRQTLSAPPAPPQGDPAPPQAQGSKKDHEKK